MIIEFVPIEYYTSLYYHVLFIICLIVFVQHQIMSYSKQNLSNFKLLGVFLLCFVILYMGLRPVSGRYFGDMATYATKFNQAVQNLYEMPDKDVAFSYFIIYSSKIMTLQTFFLLCAMLYVIPLFICCKKWFKKYWFYAFLMLIGSFSFWAYGTNGIRNGIATSIFLLAICSEKKIFQILLMILSISLHKSMLLPSCGYVFTWFYNHPKGYFYFWLLSIPLSLALPGFWENLFAGIFEDERVSYFIEGNVNDDSFSSTGFRWDFLLYSSIGVFAGWYYIFKKKIQYPIYINLYNTFLFANAFWILVIRANFSNRFAYLSWFMLALVIIYPWLKSYFIVNQNKKLGIIILTYFCFTYFMNVFVYG